MWRGQYLIDVCRECLRADLLALLAFLGVCSSSLSASPAQQEPKASLLAWPQSDSLRDSNAYLLPIYHHMMPWQGPAGIAAAHATGHANPLRIA